MARKLKFKRLRVKFGFLALAGFLSLIGASTAFNTNQLALALSLDELSSVSGPTAGGEEIIITGTEFLRDERVKQVVNIGRAGNYALTDFGKVFAWGLNNGSILTKKTSDEFITMPLDITDDFAGEVVASFATGVGEQSRFYALTESGKLLTWGSNAFPYVLEGMVLGALGIGNDVDWYINTPTDMTTQFGGERIKKVIASPDATYVMTESGKIFTWGVNSFGVLGIGDTGDFYVDIPTDMTTQFGSETVTEIFGGPGATFALTESSKVFAWGYNSEGILGTGNIADEFISTPTDMTERFGDERIKQIAVSSLTQRVHAISESGKVFAWGNNEFGLLGTGNTIDDLIIEPTDMAAQFGGEKIEFIDSSNSQITYAVSESGKVFAWGYNGLGILGAGDMVNDYIAAPTDMTAQFSGEKIKMIDYLEKDNWGDNWVRAIALTEPGKVFIWGLNMADWSMLGIGNITDEFIANPTEMIDRFSGLAKDLPQVTQIFFGDVEATDFEILDANRIRVKVPAHEAGAVPVTMRGLSGGMISGSSNYTYLAGGQAGQEGRENLTPRAGAQNKQTMTSVIPVYSLHIFVGISVMMGVVLRGRFRKSRSEGKY